MGIDRGADALKPFDVGFRKKALVPLCLCDENKPAPFVEANSFNRDVQPFRNFSDWKGRRIFILLIHTCSYKYKYGAIDYT